MELSLKLKLPTDLSLELLHASRETNCGPKRFAAEVIESALASRRLPNGSTVERGARITIADVPSIEAAK